MTNEWSGLVLMYIHSIVSHPAQMLLGHVCPGLQKATSHKDKSAYLNAFSLLFPAGLPASYETH